MKLSNIIITSALVLGAIACTKVNEEIPATSQEITITAYTSATKTAIQGEEGKVFWEPGDKINLFYNKAGGELTSTLTAPAATSQFTGTINAFGFNDAEQNYPLWGVYPYNAANTSDGESVTVILPSKQVAKAGTFAQNTHVTIGKSNTFSMAFYAVTGGLRFSLTRDDITSVSFMGAKGDTLAGKMQVKFDEDGTPVIVKKTAPEKILTLTAPEGQTFESGKYYYISAIPTELAGGFEMTFNTADKTAKLTSDKAVTIKRDTFGTLENADAGLTFVERTWGNPAVINKKAGTLAMEINPTTGKPVIALVENIEGSTGPLFVYNGLDATPVTVPTVTDKNHYVALGVSQSGKGYVYTENNSVSPKVGEIYSSPDLSTWTSSGLSIAPTNMYYGPTIGTWGNEAYVMTCNDKTGYTIPRRNINVTKFDGSTWTTDNILAGRPTSNTYYPVMTTFNGDLYTFVTDVSVGFTIYKYDGSTWSTVVAVKLTDEMKKFTYDIYEPQGIAIAPDGQIWLAIGLKSSPYGIVVLKINVEEETVAQVGETFNLNGSIQSRSGRILINPKNEEIVYLVFRDDNQCLNVSALDYDTWEWKTPEVLTSYAVADITTRYTADGTPYIACSAGDHVEVFTTIK